MSNKSRQNAFCKSLNISKVIFVGLTALAVISLNVATINAATVTPGDDLFIPSGLTIGDTYQLVFLAFTATTATSTDIASYNSFVQAEANSSSLTSGIDWYAAMYTSGTKVLKQA